MFSKWPKLRNLDTKPSLAGVITLLLAALGWIGDANDAIGLPEFVSTVWGWLESPYGFWIAFAIGIGLIGYAVFKPPAKAKPSLRDIATRTEKLEAQVSELWGDRPPPAPYCKLNFLTATFPKPKQATIHFKIDTNLTGMKVERVQLRVSGKRFQPLSWDTLNVDESDTALVTFNLPDWVVPAEYKSKLIVWLYGMGTKQVDFILSVTQ